MHKIVLLRHGQSQWNLENRFTGWTDVDLSVNGIAEAKHAAGLLKAAGFVFDKAYCSLLKRAVRTLWLVLDGIDRMWLPVEKDWRLNERHYGALEGLDKAQTALKYGERQVHVWRRSFDVPPPLLDAADPRSPRGRAAYKNIEQALLPLGESLKDTIARFMPLWHERITPDIRAGKTLLIAAHGNTLRALVKHLNGISDADIAAYEIPTGVPLVYELDADLKPLKSYYLKDSADAA